MDKNDLNLILSVVLFALGLLISTLISVIGPIAGIAVVGFLIGLAAGAWITHLHYRAPP